MGKLMTIGGGELRDGETLAIDRRIVELTGKSRPRALFIPTASGDAVGYYDTFRSVYGDQLGCEPDVLYLTHSRPSPSEIESKFGNADLMYVGGGNTLRMMKLWRRLGIDQQLHAAYHRGVVLSGLSAGAICWYAYGHSDSRSFSGAEAWSYIRVQGLGMVNAIFCPHVDGENRLPKFQTFMSRYTQMGLGCDDCCALEIIDDQYRVITSREGAKAYRVFRQSGQVVTQEIYPSNQSQPLADLLTK